MMSPFQAALYRKARERSVVAESFAVQNNPVAERQLKPVMLVYHAPSRMISTSCQLFAKPTNNGGGKS